MCFASTCAFIGGALALVAESFIHSFIAIRRDCIVIESFLLKLLEGYENIALSQQLREVVKHELLKPRHLDIVMCVIRKVPRKRTVCEVFGLLDIGIQFFANQSTR
jgi:tryptophanase